MSLKNKFKIGTFFYFIFLIIPIEIVVQWGFIGRIILTAPVVVIFYLFILLCMERIKKETDE